MSYRKYFSQALQKNYPARFEEIIAEANRLYAHISKDTAFARASANPMDRRLDFAAYFLAMIQALEKQGEPFERIKTICLEVAEAYVMPKNRLQRWLKRVPARLVSFRPMGLFLKSLGRKVAERGHPDGFVARVLADKGETYGLGYGIDILECGICKLFRKRQAEHYASILCEVDKITSAMAGLQLIRSGTIAHGAPKCDFRFVKAEKYDRIGRRYNHTRRADPYLLERMRLHLQPENGRQYLDVGCGTGNYTIALAQAGGVFTGLDPSGTMLETARRRSGSIQWVLGRAEQLPFPPESFDGALASLTTHHWADMEKGLAEIYRVLKPGGRLVVFTATPEQMKGYWLNHYFPAMMAASIAQMPSWERVEQALRAASFGPAVQEKYFIRDDLQDLFLNPGKHRPEMYFDEQVRAGISSFSGLANQTEVQAGLERLKQDIDAGVIASVIRQYDNESGDYLFIVASKLG